MPDLAAQNRRRVCSLSIVILYEEKGGGAERWEVRPDCVPYVYIHHKASPTVRFMFFCLAYSMNELWILHLQQPPSPLHHYTPTTRHHHHHHTSLGRITTTELPNTAKHSQTRWLRLSFAAPAPPFPRPALLFPPQIHLHPLKHTHDRLRYVRHRLQPRRRQCPLHLTHVQLIVRPLTREDRVVLRGGVRWIHHKCQC